ncbi:glycosyltransferase [Pedobacter antarcticus]|uniref:glycosyltransferase n=1 Tax=Pedobacter antarcticus TaxID=34086 RepID=UPI00087E3CFF|nr:glycosyltransferase [Pedobacter antarcticus]SDM17242.1 Glycosyltransferase involved in cell wall bisynthesis [Pedobacter antarcticus]
MINVIFFVTSLQSGGIENYLLRFIEEKHQQFSQITVFCKGGIGGQLENRYRSIYNVKIVKSRISFINPIHYLKLKSFLISNNPDAVCDFTGNFSGVILYLAKLAGIKKRIAFYRGSTDHFKSSFFKSKYNNFSKKLVYSCATDILSNSKAALNFFYTHQWQKDQRFEVIYNGIDSLKFDVRNGDNLRKELNIPQSAFVIGHTGRYNVAKNHETVIEVALKLVAAKSDIYFILCGNGVKNNLQEVIDRTEYSDRILLFENRSDIPIFLNTMNCYYFPSLTEGQPNALIEAMLMGVPVVASNIEPIKETVPECINSFLVNPLDSNKAADIILKIYKSGVNQDLKDWVIKNYDSKRLFQQFYKRFECQ